MLFVNNISSWCHLLSGKISSWIDLDSEDETMRKDSETSLKQEIAWASHLSLQVNSYLSVGHNKIKILVKLTLALHACDVCFSQTCIRRYFYSHFISVGLSSAYTQGNFFCKLCQMSQSDFAELEQYAGTARIKFNVSIIFSLPTCHLCSYCFLLL